MAVDYNKKYVGKEFVSSKSGKFRIIKYTKSEDVDVVFLNTGNIVNTTISRINTGRVRDPLAPTVSGVGIVDLKYAKQKFKKVGGKNVRVWSCPYYDRWKIMLARCYDDKYHTKYPTYKDCVVCDEWKTFSNFKSWMEKQDWEGKHLDKDILGDGTVYEERSCSFILPIVNTFLTEANSIRGDYPLGVSKDRGHLVSKCRDPFLDRQITLKYLSPTDCIENVGHNLWRLYKQTVIFRMRYNGYIEEDEIYHNLLKMYYVTNLNENLLDIIKEKLQIQMIEDIDEILNQMKIFNKERY